MKKNKRSCDNRVGSLELTINLSKVFLFKRDLNTSCITRMNHTVCWALWKSSSIVILLLFRRPLLFFIKSLRCIEQHPFNFMQNYPRMKIVTNKRRMLWRFTEYADGKNMIHKTIKLSWYVVSNLYFVVFLPINQRTTQRLNNIR